MWATEVIKGSFEVEVAAICGAKTLPLERGLEQARCIACAFAVLVKLERNRPQWIAKFKSFRELRATLHGGRIVTAEVGIDRHKIAYFGDVMNTTARLEQVCRQTGEAVLISEPLLQRLPALPDAIVARSLGQFDLRGRGAALGVYSLAMARA